MSVVITGMDMPENCMKCNSINCFLPYKKNTNREVVKKKYMTVRHEDCPLKSVDGLIQGIEIEICSRNYYTRETDTRDKIIGIIKEYCEMEGSNNAKRT